MKEDTVSELSDAVHEMPYAEEQSKTRKVKRWIVGGAVFVGAALFAAVALASRNNEESE